MATQLCSPKTPENVVPEHGILSVITLRYAMVYVVYFAVVEGHIEHPYHDIVPGVVQSSEHSTNAKEEQSCNQMDRHDLRADDQS